MSTQYDFSIPSEDSETDDSGTSKDQSVCGVSPDSSAESGDPEVDTPSVYEIYERLEHSQFDSIRDKCYDRSEAEDRLAELQSFDSRLDREYYIRAIER